MITGRAMTAGSRRALLIGVEEFSEDPDIPRLKAPRRDVAAMRRLLGSSEVGEFELEPPCINEPEFVLSRRIQDFFDRGRRDDVLLLYFAGHGMLDDYGKLHLAASDTERERLASTSIPASYLLERIHSSQSRHIFVLLDCCYAARLAEHFRGPDDDIRLDDQFDGPSAGISILSASSKLQPARESPEQSVFAQAVIAGLEDGSADLNGDGLVHIGELYQFLRQRLEDAGDRQLPRLLHDTGGKEPHIARVSGRREPESDFARYETEVLGPAVTQRKRVTRDIVKRYFLRGDFDNPDYVIDPEQVSRDVDRVIDCWDRQRGTAPREVVNALRKDHEKIYKPLFDELSNGNAGPLRHAIQIGRQAPGLVDRILELTDELRLIDAESLQQFYEEGLSTSAVQEALDAADVEVVSPWSYPPDPPAPCLDRLTEDLATLDCRHIGDLLYPPDRRSGRPAVTSGDNGDIVLSRSLLETAAASAPGRWADSALTTAQRIFQLLDTLEERELRDLLTWQLLTRLQPLAADRANPQRLAAEAQKLGLDEKAARRLAYALIHSPVPRPDEHAERLLALVARGSVVEAGRELGQAAADHIPPGPGDLAAQVRGWLARSEAWLRKASMSTAPDEVATLVARAHALTPDLTISPELMRRLAPEPATGLDHDLRDGQVLVTWQRSASSVGTIRYAVRRYRSAQCPRPGRGGILVARTPQAQLLDEHTPVNEPLWYTVTAERDGVPGDESDPHGPVLVQPDVTDERITGGDGTVEIRWRTPPQALRVLIFRSTSEEANREQVLAGPPYAIVDSLAGAEDRYVDTGVVNERYYGYWLVVAYRVTGGEEHRTCGRFLDTTPAPPPQAAVITGVTLLPDDPVRLAVDVAAPAIGRLRLLAASRTPQPAGTMLPAAQVSRVGDILQVSEREAEAGSSVIRLLVEPPAAETTLVVVTVSGERAILGDRLPWRPVVSLGPVFAERRGDFLRVSFDWQQGIEEVLLRWEQPGRGQQEITVTEARMIQVPVTGASVSVAALPVFSVGAYSLTGRPSVREVPPRPVVDYCFDHVDHSAVHRLLNRPPKLLLRLVARQEVCVPRLLLVGKRGMAQPLTPDGCEFLLTRTDLLLPAGQPVSFELPRPRPRGTYWLACFAPDSGIDLRDPPVENRRIR